MPTFLRGTDVEKGNSITEANLLHHFFTSHTEMSDKNVLSVCWWWEEKFNIFFTYVCSDRALEDYEVV